MERLGIDRIQAAFDGTLAIVGWVVSEHEKASVTLFITDRQIGQATAEWSKAEIISSSSDQGRYKVLRFDWRGSFESLAPGEANLRVVMVDEGGFTLSMVRLITIPVLAKRPDAEISEQTDGIAANCDLATITPLGHISIKGWAFSKIRISSVALFDGDIELGSATIGLPRPDVALAYPSAKHAGRSGFNLELESAGSKYEIGSRLSLRIRTASGLLAAADLILTAAHSSATVKSGRAVLEIDTPALGKDNARIKVNGQLELMGWAVAPSGISKVLVFCDSRSLGQANIGFRRHDVADHFPNYEGSLRAGFALVLPSGAIDDGSHTIKLIAIGRCGEEAQREFTIDMSLSNISFPGASLREFVPAAEVTFAETVLKSRSYRPSLIVILQIRRASAGLADSFMITITSLLNQAYQNFKVIIAAQNSSISMICEKVVVSCLPFKGRVKVVDLSSSPAPNALRRELEQSSLFMVLFDGDRLGADALLEFAVSSIVWPNAGLIYCDDIRIDCSTNHAAAFFKPNWSPEMLLNLDYLGRAWCVPLATLRLASIPVIDLCHRQPYDLILQITEHAKYIQHINRLLVQENTWWSGDPAPSLKSAIRRRQMKAKIVRGKLPNTWRVKRKLEIKQKVSIIIPTAGYGNLVRRAIGSLRSTTTGMNIEIVVVDNVPQSGRRLKQWLAHSADIIVDIPGSFNWSRFNNKGVTAATGNYYLFLNDDVEALQSGWLESMLELSQEPEIGVVGARLLYPDGSVQHAGQYLSAIGARHAFRSLNASAPGPFGLALVTREVSAVTGACMLIKADTFNSLGGFNEAHDVVNNDLDFCLQVRKKGLRVVVAASAELIHHELASRASMLDSYDVVSFEKDWKILLTQGDPYHSRRLMPTSDMYRLDPEPVVSIYAGPQGPGVSHIRKILAVKLDHIGDFILSIPALTSLKKGFPGAEITVLVSPAAAALARAQHVIKDVIVFQFFHDRSADGLNDLEEEALSSLEELLKSKSFDLAIDLRLHPETRPILLRSGAPFLAGFDYDSRYSWLDVSTIWEGDQRLAKKHKHVSVRISELVAATINACAELPASSIPAPKLKSKSPLAAVLSPAALKKLIICIHPGVGNSTRRWPQASYSTLIDLLIAEFDAEIVIVGGPDEHDIVAEVIGLVDYRTHVHSLVGMTTLADLPEVLSACSLFVGNNSGPHHLAAALGIPTLGIHSGVVDATEWAPLGPAAVALRRSVTCSPCYLAFAEDCPRGMTCLTGIQPREVLAMCRRLLAIRQ